MCDVYHEGNTAYFGLKCPMPGAPFILPLPRTDPMAECGGRMRLEYTSEQLYLQVRRRSCGWCSLTMLQILYLKRLFDLKDAERRLQLENSERKERGFVSLKAPVFANEERVRKEEVAGWRIWRRWWWWRTRWWKRTRRQPSDRSQVAMEVMHEDCHRLLQESAFNMINLGSLFACEAEEEASM
eukprot:592676-Hanusia_phi.AAC.3